VIVDVSLVFVILVNIFFVTLLLLKDANSELVFGRKLLDVLLRTIQPVDNPREGTMDEVRGGEERSDDRSLYSTITNHPFR